MLQSADLQIGRRHRLHVAASETVPPQAVQVAAGSCFLGGKGKGALPPSAAGTDVCCCGGGVGIFNWPLPSAVGWGGARCALSVGGGGGGGPRGRSRGVRPQRVVLQSVSIDNLLGPGLVWQSDPLRNL